ncbi:MAG: hypothetical protein GKS07_08765 [Nitrosopumilus sp.]|nr:MAG: hypothetical protein GKS07_08765 [Nitrosopumilus sp.]
MPIEYEIFVDTIQTLLGVFGIIFAVLFGGATYGLYIFLSSKFEKKTKETTSTVIRQKTAKLYLAIGYNSWQQFNMLNERIEKTKRTKEEALAMKSMLDYALDVTSDGLNELDGLDVDENEKSLCMLKNNYAYFLTEYDSWNSEDKKQAQILCDFISVRSIKYKDRKKDWYDTIKVVNDKYVTEGDERTINPGTTQSDELSTQFRDDKHTRNGIF